MSSPDRADTARRLFFALWPDDALRARLKHLVRKGCRGGGGRPVPIENLHITLSFLGAVAPEALPCIERSAGALRAAPFTLILDRIGHFPRPRVLWLGCAQTPQALRDLARDLGEGLRGCGIEPEARPFHAHMTLMRKVNRAPPPVEIEALEWAVREFVLVESATLPGGARYTVRARWPLSPAPSADPGGDGGEGLGQPDRTVE